MQKEILCREYLLALFFVTNIFSVYIYTNLLQIPNVLDSSVVSSLPRYCGVERSRPQLGDFPWKKILIIKITVNSVKITIYLGKN